MQLAVRPINVAAFTCSKGSKTFTAEASDLKGCPTLQPLYDDAADIGLALYNPATNVSTVWYWADNEYDREGDLLGSKYMPTYETLRRNPQLEGWTVHILND